MACGGTQDGASNVFPRLIQLTADNLKHCAGYRQAANSLMLPAITRLEQVPKAYMGIDVASLLSNLNEHRPGPALIRFHR